MPFGCCLKCNLKVVKVGILDDLGVHKWGGGSVRTREGEEYSFPRRIKQRKGGGLFDRNMGLGHQALGKNAGEGGL